METHSAIQGSPLAIMDANLNSSGVFNISPVFEYSDWLVSKVNSLPSRFLCYLEDIHPLHTKYYGAGMEHTRWEIII